MNTRKPALGRGLSALLPGKGDVPRGTHPREVEIGRLKVFRREVLAELLEPGAFVLGGFFDG